MSGERNDPTMIRMPAPKPADPKDASAIVQPGDRVNCNACGSSRKWGQQCRSCGHWTDAELLYHLGDRLHRTIEAYGEIEQLHAALTKSAPGWRPIETAPKDGTVAFGWHPEYGVARIEWGDDEWWVEPAHDHPGNDGADIPDPTHWQPLPSAPQEKGR